MQSEKKYSPLVSLIAIVFPGLIDRISRKRVNEIAAWLDDNSVSFGRSIDERKIWDTLAKQGAIKKNLADERKKVRRAIPKNDDPLYLEFSKSGIRKNWETIEFERRRILKCLCLAECAENKGRFIPKLEKIIW